MLIKLLLNIQFYTFVFFDHEGAIKGVKEVIEPVFHAVMTLLYTVLVFTVLYKIVLLSRDLAQSSDEPEKRAEIKKAFFYSLAAPVVVVVASSIVHVIVKEFIFRP
jgi:hypothetical protein